jgi:hypothetical protein
MRQLPAVSPTLAQQVWEGMSNPSTRRVAQKIRGNHSLRKQKPSPAGFLLARVGNRQ